jgi:Polyketide cyclase / dehydrase and lipid transport
MTGELRIDVVIDTTAPPDAVWKLLADVTTWKDWGPWDRAELERAGTGDPAGVGALRRFRYLRRITREEVVAFEPPRRFAYELRSGLPLRNYHGEVTLVPAGTGSRLEWHSRFDATLPGRLWRPGLARFIRTTANRLVRAAEAA